MTIKHTVINRGACSRVDGAAPEGSLELITTSGPDFGPDLSVGLTEKKEEKSKIKTLN